MNHLASLIKHNLQPQNLFSGAIVTRLLTAIILTGAIPSFSGTLPSIEELFRTPRYSSPSLSPDGKYFVALYTESDQTSLASINLETKEAGRTGLPAGCDIYGYHWVSNDEIIYEMSRYKRFVDNIGVISRDLKPPRMLIENKLVSIIDGLVHDREHALIWFRNNPDDNSPNEDLRKVNVFTGRYGKPEADFVGRVLEWVTDDRGAARFARVYKTGANGEDDFYYRDAADAGWQKTGLSHVKGIGIYGFVPGGSRLYVSMLNGKNTFSLCEYDLKRNEMVKEIFNDPEYDFDGRLCFPGSSRKSSGATFKGIIFHGKSVWFDSSMADIQRDLDALLTTTTNEIIDADTLLAKFLVASYSDIQPRRYLLFDTQTKEIVQIAEKMPWIHAEEMCPVSRMSFITRDSLKLTGFLTRSKTGKAPCRTVVLLHGGPHLRDEWEFNPEVQLLATRGYTVLQVNYRGSSGFGMQVSESCRFDYYEMHRDVTEATVKTIRSGLIDPERVAIMGASFGGYLAISGAAFEPDLYTCAVSNAGVFDWKYQWEHFKEFANSRYYDEMLRLVSSKADVEEFFRKASPIHAAQHIKIPVLLAGGRNDWQVPVKQSYRLARKMRKEGNRPETYFKVDETHGFHYEENRVRYYERVLDFLDKNMKRSRTSGGKYPNPQPEKK